MTADDFTSLLDGLAAELPDKRWGSTDASLMLSAAFVGQYNHVTNDRNDPVALN